MLSDKAVAYVIDHHNNSFYKFNHAEEKISYSMETGIIGLVAKSGELMTIKDPYKHPNYNSKVDLDTRLPMVCLPVLSTKEPKKVLAVMQVLDLKVAGRCGGNQDLIESETIRLFQKQVAVCIEHFTRTKVLQFHKVQSQVVMNILKKEKSHHRNEGDTTAKTKETKETVIEEHE